MPANYLVEMRSNELLSGSKSKVSVQDYFFYFFSRILLKEQNRFGFIRNNLNRPVRIDWPICPRVITPLLAYLGVGRAMAVKQLSNSRSESKSTKGRFYFA